MQKNISRLALIILFVSLFFSCMTTSGKSETLIKTSDDKEEKTISTEVKTSTDTKVEPIVIVKTQSEEKKKAEKKESNTTIQSPILIVDYIPTESSTPTVVEEQSSAEITADEVQDFSTPEVSTETEKVETKTEYAETNEVDDTEEDSLGYRIAKVALVFSIIIFGLLFIAIRVILYLRRKTRK